MKRTELKNAFKHLKFDLIRSRIYYEKRMAFWNGLTASSQVLELLLSSFAFVSSLKGCSCVVQTLTLISTVIGALVVTFKSSSRAQKHLEQRNAFVDLLKRIPSDRNAETKELYDSIVETRLELEKKDDAILPCLSIICHNEAHTSLGSPEYEKYRLNFIEHTIGRIFRIPYTPKPLIYPRQPER